MGVDLAVATPVFLDYTFVGLEGLPGPGEERFAGDMLRSPGGGAITAIGAVRLGLSAAVAAPIGRDLPGTFVCDALREEGVGCAEPSGVRTPVTVVMPVAGERSMVTVDPGARARRADLEALEPRAVAVNLELIDRAPSGPLTYVTCGDDDARAFAGKLPPKNVGARALFLNAQDACVLTSTDTAQAAAEALAAWVGTVVITVDARTVLAMVDGHTVAVPDFDPGPVVDTTGDRDLLCAAYAWADLRGAQPEERISWAQLYSQLAMGVPTAVGGAVSEERLLEEGAKHGLARPSRARG
jgi:ribokinase